MKIGVCGNLTIDELLRNGARIVRPGGSALFSSLAASALGAKVSILSTIGDDYPRKVLSKIKRKGIDTTRVDRFSGKTTRFRISYSQDNRILELIYPGKRLGSNSKFSAPLDAIHLGPVFGEIGIGVLSHARRRCKFLSVDVQGLMRVPDSKGRVRLVRRNIDPFLSKCNLLKATEKEVRVLAPKKTILSSARQLLRWGAEHAVITRGPFGALLVTSDGMIQMPSIPKTRIVDPTGAGDIFTGSWLATFRSANDPHWAGAVGAAFASLSVEKIGLAKFRFSRSELFRRAAWAYNNSKLVSL